MSLVYINIHLVAHPVASTEQVPQSNAINYRLCTHTNIHSYTHTHTHRTQ